MFKATCPKCKDVIWMSQQEMFLVKLEEPEEQIAICEVCEEIVNVDQFNPSSGEEFEAWPMSISAA